MDVNKLVKGRPLDNMEFMQWLKFYFEGRLGCQDLDYDPVGRRCASLCVMSCFSAASPFSVSMANAVSTHSKPSTCCGM